MTMTQVQLRAEATDCRSRGGVPEHASRPPPPRVGVIQTLRWPNGTGRGGRPLPAGSLRPGGADAEVGAFACRWALLSWLSPQL